MIDVETLRKLLRYEPETGRFYRLPRPRADFNDLASYRRWLVRYEGKEALFAKHAKGYRAGAVAGITVLAHRAAWAMHYGRWPSGLIDHINGNPADNRISNLRECNNAQNLANGAPRAGTSRFKGVVWRPSNRKWISNITVRGKYIHLGTFNSETDAANAYDAAAKLYFGEFARLNTPNP